MNDIDLLILAVERDPYNPIPASMLTDELMEEKGMLRSEADRHVSAVQKASIGALQLLHVSALCACPGEPKDRVQTLLEAHWPDSTHPHALVFFITGDSAPVKVIGSADGSPHAALDVVYVGADFILSRVSKTLVNQALQAAAIVSRAASKKKRR